MPRCPQGGGLPGVSIIITAGAGYYASARTIFTIMLFDKEFKYTWLDVKDYYRLHEHTQRFIEMKELDTVKTLAVHLRQKTQGNQMWVAKEVSDDLLSSDIDVTDFAALEWPHNVLEFYFEDPAIPTFLFHKRKHGDNLQLLRDLTGHDITNLFRSDSPSEYVYDFVVCRDNGVSASTLILTDETIDDLCKSDFIEKYADIFAENPDVDDRDAVHNAATQLVLLAYKVLLFASSEGCAPQRVTTKPTKAEGGKPGFNNRPNRPRMKVVYLPAHRKERKKQAAEVSGKSHAFNGRRGHWRVYQADRYVRMKGRRVFIYPVPDADGNYPKRQFKVVAN